MLYFNSLFENVVPPTNNSGSTVANSSYTGPQMSNPTSSSNSGPQMNSTNSVASNNAANISKMSSSNVQTNNKIDNSDREIASLVNDAHNL